MDTTDALGCCKSALRILGVPEHILDGEATHIPEFVQTMDKVRCRQRCGSGESSSPSPPTSPPVSPRRSPSSEPVDPNAGTTGSKRRTRSTSRAEREAQESRLAGRRPSSRKRTREEDNSPQEPGPSGKKAKKTKKSREVVAVELPEELPVVVYNEMCQAQLAYDVQEAQEFVDSPRKPEKSGAQQPGIPRPLAWFRFKLCRYGWDEASFDQLYGGKNPYFANLKHGRSYVRNKMDSNRRAKMSKLGQLELASALVAEAKASRESVDTPSGIVNLVEFCTGETLARLHCRIGVALGGAAKLENVSDGVAGVGLL